MKNILILHNSLDYTKSGVERVSFLLKKELANRGYNCFEGCITGENKEHREDVFVYNFNDSRKLVLSNLFTYLAKYKIDIILIQGLFDPNINYALSYLKRHSNCKIIFCLHNAPSAYTRKIPLSFLERIKIFIWYLVKFHTFVVSYHKHRLNMLKQMFGIADRFVLLSETYIDEFYQISNIRNSKRVIGINNPLTFQKPIVDLDQKKKQVLILGRLEDFQKNISSALRIWKQIERSGINDWNLVIVGSGVDDNNLRNYAKTLNLKHCAFVGETTEPEKFYQESSIFMMTSHVEGWPMTLLEAQQYGCVPIVFNTFAAISEIIEDNITGRIIEKDNEIQFFHVLAELMKSNEQRKEIAQYCTKERPHFSAHSIGDQWESLFKSL